MEIERKFLIKTLPEDLDHYTMRMIEQGYLCTEPVVRVRRDNDLYELTYKSKGLISREEVNLTLDAQSYEHLLKKVDGHIITKERYMIPYLNYMIELDIFKGVHEPLIVAEVEFPTEEEANKFTPPSWFSEDVSLDGKYHNSNLCKNLLS